MKVAVNSLSDPGHGAILRLLAAGLLLILGACESGDGAKTPPMPQVLTRDAVGYYCSMIVEEHEGPKGQIVLDAAGEVLWFTSVRDTLAFLVLPEEPKNVAAVYVTNMAEAPWEHPEHTSGVWIDPRSAWFVIGSRRVGGMGQSEAVPFAERKAAEAFAGEFGGEVVDYPSLPRSYILGSA